MIYFSADLHISHGNIIKSCNRPFSSVEEMNSTLINNWNSVVSSDDIVYFLGDIYFKNPKLAGQLADQLNGKIILILGNHDKLKDIKKYFSPNRFIEIHEDIRNFKYKLNDKNYFFHLYHFPIWSWNCRTHGSFHLFGHSHHHDALWNDFSKNNLSMDVGVDGNNYTPISIEKVIELMEEKKKILNV